MTIIGVYTGNNFLADDSAVSFSNFHKVSVTAGCQADTRRYGYSNEQDVVLALRELIV